MAPSIDEFEDLTQFADESFDTEEVDLFEFTDDEDSPLLRLKSIVLSLDWDITEEILTELNEELANLRTMWKDDKVAQIYLQGMENVGKYMREEGAYAHPNAIKLLLTLYHNYEKIISSPNISGDSITTMLKADIRKFKVLQYQISTLKKSQNGHDEAIEASTPDNAKGASASAVQSAKKESTEPPPLRSMEATILGLEWEVTDEGLEKFNAEAMELRNYLSSNTEAQVLVQGLQALGAYIREQKTNAHPDAFTILHSFYDALKMLLESPQLGAEQRRQILIEQISSLNSLKEVIARSAASKAAEQEDADEPESVDKNGLTDDQEESDDSPAVADEDEMDFSFSFDDEEDGSKPENKVPPAAAPQPAVKPKTVQSPPTPPVKPVEASADDEDEFDDDLFADSSSGITPALADEDEEGGFSDSLSSASMSADRAAELDEKLDSFFNFSGEDAEELKPKAVSSPRVEADAPAAPKKPEKLSLTTILEDVNEEDGEPDEDDGIDSSFFNFDDEHVVTDKAASIDDDADDSILNGDDELFSGVADKDKGQRLSETGAESNDEEEEADDELDSFFNFDEDIDVGKSNNALKVAEDEVAAPAVQDKDAEDDTLSSGLDSFFSFDDEAEAEKTESKALPKTAVSGDEEEQDSLNLDSGLFGGAEEVLTPALTDEDETVPAAHEEEAEDDTLSSGLDSFFSFDDEVEAEKTESKALPEIAVSGDDEEQDSLSLDSGLFGGAEEVVTPALTDEDEAVPAAHEEEADDDTLSSGLDSFFSFDDEVEAEKTETALPETAVSGDDEEQVLAGISTDIDVERAAEIKDKLDSLFNFDNEMVTGEAADVQDDIAELDDELITALDDDEVPSSKNDFSVSALTDEPFTAAATDEDQDELFGSLNTEEEDAVATSADEQEDAFFAFGKSVLTEEPDLLDEGKPDSSFADAEEDFFGFNTDSENDDAEETLPSADIAADATAEDQDELFGNLNTEDEDSVTAATADEQEDAFFALSSEPALAEEPEEESVLDEGKSNLFLADAEEDFFSFNNTADSADDEQAEETLSSVDALADATTEEDENTVVADEREDEDLLLGQEYEEDSEPAALFGQDEMPDPFSGSSETKESAAATWSADLEEPESTPTEDDQTDALSEILSSLTAIAATLPSVPSGHHLRQVSELAAAARKEQSVPPHQSIMLNLLDSAAAMLAKAPRGTVVSSGIVQELASGLDKSEDTATLADLINHYTAWQREFFEQLILSTKQQDVVTPEVSSSEDAGLRSVEEKFSRLKQEMMAEFQRLRQELLAIRS